MGVQNTSLLEKAAGFWRRAAVLLRTTRDRSPIQTVAGLEDFIASRSAYVAQKTLYGYVKTRMGIKYVAMFNDDNIIASVNIAKFHVLAACLSDLTIYAVANALHGQPVGNDERNRLAQSIYRSALAGHAKDAPEVFKPEELMAAFVERLAATDWSSSALKADNFTASPRALLRWAPIAEKLKKFDSEIVGNSITYAWRDIREQFQKRIVPEALCADLKQATTH